MSENLWFPPNFRAYTGVESLKQFFGVRWKASNICGPNSKTYTIDDFLKFYPNFFKKDDTTDPPTYTPLIPEAILEVFIEMANESIQECAWGIKWPWAMALFIAHYATLYGRSYSDGSPDLDGATSGGEIIGLVKSASLGDASVSYDNSAIVSATEDWGAWNSTIYGQQLVTEARLVKMGGAYII